jgi:hypothetical protein
MSAEITAARALALDWAQLGTIDAIATDGDGNLQPMFNVGAAVAAEEIQRIRAGDCPTDSLLALFMCLGAMKDRALLVGFCRALQSAIGGRT